MTWENSIVMKEFMKIATDQNMLKQAKPEPNPYQEDLKTIEEKRLVPAEKHIMELAHPEPVYIAEARGDGGLVENEIEHQRKIVEMVNKMPTGSLVGRYASIVNEMIKLSEAYDDAGESETSDMLVVTASHMLDKLNSLK